MCLVIFFGKYLEMSIKLFIFAAISHNYTTMARTKLRIKELLKEKGMTQAELAERLGITPISLNQQLARNTFTLDRLEEIADIFDIRVTDLFDNVYKVNCPKCGEQINIVFNIKGFEG